MKEKQDSTSYTNYQKDGPALKIVQQAQKEMQQGPQQPNRAIPRPSPYDQPVVVIKGPKLTKGYNA